MKKLHITLLLIVTILMFFAGGVYYFLLSPIGRGECSHYIYIDRDDTKDSLIHKLSTVEPRQTLGIEWLWKITDATPRCGKYEVNPHQTSIEIFRMLRNGQQIPIKLVITPAWTVERMASRIANQLMVDSAELVNCLNDSATLALMNCTKETLPAHFIPNTYEVYWNITPQQFVNRMEREYKRFWTAERLQKAMRLGMTQHEVSTLASIVCRETNNVPEMSIIAGLYRNRMKRKMLLQACPTVIFARQDFTITRLTNPTEPDSPYNTYRYLGLPPGPIFIPPISAIEAVLNAETHNYLYMCAKEDFSGTHNFASTLTTHQRNAKKYQRAYKQRFKKTK